MLIIFIDDIKFCGLANPIEDRKKRQNDLNNLKKWAESNRMNPMWAPAVFVKMKKAATCQKLQSFGK